MATPRTTELAALIVPLLVLVLAEAASAQCGATARGGCLTSEHASLLVRDKAGTDLDQIKWKWAKGDAFAQSDLGAPATTTTYSLCLYDSTAGANALVATVRIDPNAAWTDADPKGWKYKDVSGAEDGVRKALLKTGESARTKAQVLAKGEALVVPVPVGAEYFDEDPRVVAQLVNDETQACWSSVFESASKNVAGLYKAKASGPPVTTTSTTSTTSTSTTTSTTTTTNTLPPGCPDTIEMVMHAGVGTYDTATALDVGWTGFGHDQDLADGAKIALRISSVTGSGPDSCGEATIGGVDPAAGNCRCNHDRLAECTKFGVDPVGCGTGLGCTTNADCKVCSTSMGMACLVDGDCPTGEHCLNGLQTPTCTAGQCVGTCECYLAPPEPVSVATTPRCIVRKLAADVSGTWNVDTGESELTVPIRMRAYGGETLGSPCPVCVGDVTVDDGVRDGTCLYGQNDGGPCDADALDATFPLPNGGAHSYDCYPSLGKNIAGVGVDLPMTLTTGSVTLSAANPCGLVPGGPTEVCPCGACSDATFRACSSNADCGACTTNADCGSLGECGPGNRCSCGPAGILQPRANQCTTGVCLDLGDGAHGECDVGPDFTWCDGALRADGSPLVSCLSNTDCDQLDCGSGAGLGLCGTCSVTTRSPCFLDPIVASGAGGGSPVHVGLTCTDQFGTAGNITVFGLPGPMRMTIESTATIRCPGGGVYPPCPQ